MATYRKRNGKWQAIVRHKDIGKITRSFKAKPLAVKWVAEQENKLEARQDVINCIEMFYNPMRKHVKNGMLSTVEFERQQEMRNEGV